MISLNEYSHQHAADVALEALFIAIYDGVLAPGESLPSERLLAERYGVSRIIVRQAVHKLKDVGLVEVRQGGATRVLDPAKADARVLELLLRYGSRLQSGAAEQLLRDLQEYQELYAVGLLEAAARHASTQERERLLALLEACPQAPSEDQARMLDRQFWQAIATMGKNRILQMEMALWRRWSGADIPLDDEPDELRWFYHALAKQLHACKDPIPFYLATVRTQA
ncbi:MAG: GntR family transcriptional regulator [Pseudomonas sp.]|uniref:FadR/GntR family transcriptional regulator n=1 Tax=Pseudomonas sp. TaxID=306 RepID=UPI0027374EE5|nr:GntR family transcriptional regulator [Pseudomonas sp.]MDP3844916.1 GntR family transcriptional regulator [Pseudomonas sp.]